MSRRHDPPRGTLRAILFALAARETTSYPELAAEVGKSLGAVYLSIRRAEYRGWFVAEGFVRRRGKIPGEGTVLRITTRGRVMAEEVRNYEARQGLVGRLLCALGRGAAPVEALAADHGVSVEDVYATVLRRKHRAWFEVDEGWIWVTDVGASATDPR